MSRDHPHILIVEDEMLVAMDLEATMMDQGWKVLGPAPDVRRALALLDTETPDAACLDMNLKGGTSAEVAKVLVERGIPFVLVTGYSERNVNDPAFRDAPLVHKPFVANQLISTISDLLVQG